MPVGDDFFPYSFTFSNGEEVVGVALNGTFVRRVLGCGGERVALQECVDRWQEVLAEEALTRRSEWMKGARDEGGRGVDFVCVLGLSGVAELDQHRDYSSLRQIVSAKQGRN